MDNKPNTYIQWTTNLTQKLIDKPNTEINRQQT